MEKLFMIVGIVVLIFIVGCLSGCTKTEEPNESYPVANFTYSINDLRVTFNALESYDSDGHIVNYTFDFGDKSITNGGPVVVFNHSYLNYGNFDVTLTVTDNDGYIGNITKTISVDDLIPLEIVDNTPATAYTGDSFTFNASIIDNVGISTAWVEYWIDSESHINVSLTNIASGIWTNTITINDTANTFNYYIISAKDTSNNWYTTPVKKINVHDIESLVRSGGEKAWNEIHVKYNYVGGYDIPVFMTATPLQYNGTVVPGIESDRVLLAEGKGTAFFNISAGEGTYYSRTIKLCMETINETIFYCEELVYYQTWTGE